MPLFKEKGSEKVIPLSNESSSKTKSFGANFTQLDYKQESCQVQNSLMQGLTRI